MLAIIRGHNILWLDKFDFTKHPMSRQIIKTSLTTYYPASRGNAYATVPPVPSSHTEKQDEPRTIYSQYSAISSDEF